MKLHWLAIGILAFSSALTPQTPPPADNDAPADEPGRAVARLAVLNGDASIRRGDSSEWVAAAINSPLMSGDEISVAAGGRAEVQLDEAHFLRIAGDTQLRLADLENGHYQVQISHGLVTWRVLRDTQAQAEIDTPLVGVHPGPQSTVRIGVNPDGVSHITVRRGDADVSTQRGTERVNQNSTMDVRGDVNDPEFQTVAAPARDEFDSWGEQRDNYLLRAQSQRYVTRDVHGVEDLDAYGRWNYDPAYGWVWAPQVAAGWAPYQNGQWVWEDYYGWTWVDYSPWGWAPFHYGYWYNRVGFGWNWYPGPRVGRVWWRPAMVGFFGWGGGGISFGFGNVGWVPLAPHEVFRPWYGRGGYGNRINIVNNVNVYNTYRNASAPHGVTAVAASDFQRGNFRNTVAVDRGTLERASLARGAMPVTPTSQNLRFSNRAATVTGGQMNQRFYGGNRTAGNSVNNGANNNVRRTPFTQQQQQQSNVQVQNNAPTQRNWSRFQSTPQSGNNRDMNNRAAAPAVRQANPGFDRFGSTPNSSQNSSPRQVQVAPPIVRQRSEPAPAQQAPQQYRNTQPSYGQGGYSRPQQSAPAPAPRQAAPTYSPAPAPSRREAAPSYGGGGYSRPQQSAPAPAPRGNFGDGAPQRSAPAPRSNQGAPPRGNGRR